MEIFCLRNKHYYYGCYREKLFFRYLGYQLKRYQFFQKCLISDYFFALPDDEFVKKFEILQT